MNMSERAVVPASAAEVLPVHGQVLALAEFLQARGEQILDPPLALLVGCLGADREPAGEARMVHWPQSRLTVAGAAAGGGHLAGVAAEPGQVPGGVFGADISFGCHHGVSFGHASRRPIRTNP